MAYTIGGKSGPTGNMSSELQVLLDAAQMHGGSLDEVVAELAHPQRSIMATASNALKNTFHATLKVINTPLNIVAGGLSKEYSIKEAMDENLMVSDVVFGSHYKTEGASRGLEFAARTAVDILSDPSTYVTFGAGRFGLVGTTALTKIEVGKKFAKLMGKEAKDKVMLSKAGQKTFNDVSSYFADPSSVKLTKAQKSIANDLNAERTQSLRKNYLDQKEDEIYERLIRAKKPIKTDQVAKELKFINDNVTDDVIAKQLLDGKLNQDFAKRAVTNMLEYNPDLRRTLLDAGGIKVLNKTILSGQRIKGITNAIPGMSVLDKVTSPIRHTLGRMFDTRTTSVGKAQEGAFNMIKKYDNIMKNYTARELRSFQILARNLDLEENEYDLILSALEHSRRPQDPKAAAIWDTMQGMKPDSNILSDDVITAAGFIQAKFKRQLKDLHAAGIQVSEMDNYYRHYVKEKIRENVFKARKSFGVDKPKRAFVDAFQKVDEVDNRFSGFSETIEKDGNIFIQVKDKDGKSISKLKLHNKERAQKEIQERVDEALTQSFNKIDTLRAEVDEFAKDIQKNFDKKTLKQFADYIRHSDDVDATTKKYLLEKVLERGQKVDIASMIDKRLKASFKDGMKIRKDMDKLSEDDLLKLLDDTVNRKDIDPKNVLEFNKMLKKAIKAKKGAKKAKATKEGVAPEKVKGDYTLDDFEEDILSSKKSYDVRQSGIVDEALDSRKMSEVIGMMRKDFQDNIPGSARILDKIIRRQQNINDILADADIERISGIKNFQDVDKIREGSYIDELTGEEFQRVRVMVDEARELGVDFETNVLAVTLRSSLDVVRNVVSTNLTRDYARHFGQLASESPKHWRAINFSEFKLEGGKVNFSDMVTAANGEELVFHPANAEAFENMVKGMMIDDVESMMKGYDKLQNFVKASLTTIHPMFHGRNAISNVFLNYTNLGADALNPALNASSFSMMAKESKFNRVMQTYEKGITAPEGSKAFKDALNARETMNDMNKQVILTDKAGYRWTYGELRGIIKNNVIAFNPNVVGRFDVDRSVQENIENIISEASEGKTIGSKIKRNIKGAAKLEAEKISLFKGGLKVGSAVEDHARLVSFLGNLRRTGDVELAANRTKQFLFDYSNITDFERKVMRRIIPFYTFMRKNMELQVTTLLREPAKIAQQMRAIDTIGDAISGDTLTDEERENLPEWLQRGLIILKSRSGPNVDLLLGVDTPTEAMFEQASLQGLVNSISPLIKYPMEAATGYSMFRQREFSELTKADAFRYAPDILKDYIGFTEYEYETREGKKVKMYRSLRPERMNNVLNFPLTSRVLSAWGKITKPDGSIDEAALYLATGISAQEYNLDAESAAREKELKEKIEQKLQDAGLGYTFKRFNLSN
jgi:hypothetical protein